MKKQRGISLITLIITIVVIIILAGISVYNGINKNVTETTNTMDYNEILEVSSAVSERALLNKLNAGSYGLVGETGVFDVDMKIKSGDEVVNVHKEYSSSDGWYKLTPEASKELNLDKIKKTYIINYGTGEVISFEAIEYDNQNYYSSIALNDVISGNVIISAADSYDEEGGMNKPYLVTGMIPVKRFGDDWIVTTPDDPNWYDYAAQDDGKGNLWANIMLMDEIIVEGYSNSEIRNVSLEELSGKRVISEGSMFVWIPRYSAGIVDGKTQIVFSTLTQDYFKNSEVLNAFRENGIELTGIWVSKYDASYFGK